MPRPFRTPGVSLCVAAAACCAAFGPDALHAALAAAAGTLFEAAPFVLVAEALPAGRLRGFAELAGCGCGRALPGALALPAVALCWIAFGPSVTLARTLVALGLVFARRRARGFGAEGASHETQAGSDAPDACGSLLGLAPGAALATLGSAALGTHAAWLRASLPGEVVALGAGAALGIVAPCAAATVALAAALAPHVPFAAAGLLATGGLASRPFLRFAPAHGAAPAAARSLFVRAALAVALAAFAFGRAPGFVNPRLVPFVWLATLLAIAGLRRPVTSRGALLVPAAMLAALACGSPAPSYAARETQLDDAFPGETLAFIGRAHRSGTATVLQRFAITCCRADASPVAVRLTQKLPIPDGSWVAARGTLTASPDGPELHATAWDRVRAPPDPFVYR